MNAETFPITVTAQMRHGVLWEARNLLGSTSALARLLGIPATRAGEWINFKVYPTKNWWNDKGVAIEGKLSELLGRPISYNDLFPDAIRTEAFQNIKKHQEVTTDVPLDRLIEAGAHPQLAPAPESIELKEAIETAFNSAELKPREREILAKRFGLDGYGERTLEEISEDYGLSRNRIRQLETRALNKVRHPRASRHLKSFIQ